MDRGLHVCFIVLIVQSPGDLCRISQCSRQASCGEASKARRAVKADMADGIEWMQGNEAYWGLQQAMGPARVLRGVF